jgi:glucose/arabinose dehydrogenase
MSFKHLALEFIATGFIAALASAPNASAQKPACDADNGGITLPAGFCAEVVADGLGEARHIAVAPNGDVYVALLTRPAPGGAVAGGGIVALRSTTGDGKFDMKESFGTGSSTGVALRNGYLYVAKVNSVERWKLTAGLLKPEGDAEVVVSGLPGEREHGDKSITFDGKGSFYVNIGSPSNACQERDRQLHSPGQDPCPILEQHGGIWKFDENKLGQTLADGTRYVTGLRQEPAITWHDGAVYIAMNSRDQLDTLWPGQFTTEENAERPAEPLYRAEEGMNFGWPYCFYDTKLKKDITMPEYGGDGKSSDRCGKFDLPIVAFPGHWAPVDIMFYSGSQFPAHYRDGAFIAFHGSWNRAPMPQDGYNVTFQPFADGKPSGAYEMFASGFAGKSPLMNPNDATARADGVAQAPDGSLYITDSQKGRIWRVFYR